MARTVDEARDYGRFDRPLSMPNLGQRATDGPRAARRLARHGTGRRPAVGQPYSTFVQPAPGLKVRSFVATASVLRPRFFWKTDAVVIDDEAHDARNCRIFTG
jgi:hypothetical protein